MEMQFLEQFDLMLFLKALGLALALEGMLWAAMPGTMQEAARQMGQFSTGGVRLFGLIMLGLGVLVCSLGF